MDRMDGQIHVHHSIQLITWPAEMDRKTYKQVHNGIWNFKNWDSVYSYESGKVLVMEEGESSLKQFLKYTQISNIKMITMFLLLWFIRIDGYLRSIKTDSNEIMSKYIINATSAGSSILSETGGILENIFPIIRRTKDCRFYYFCGDFADNPNQVPFRKIIRNTGTEIPTVQRSGYYRQESVFLGVSSSLDAENFQRNISDSRTAQNKRSDLSIYWSKLTMFLAGCFFLAKPARVISPSFYTGHQIKITANSVIHCQWMNDYGFNKCSTKEPEKYLFRLYWWKDNSSKRMACSRVHDRENIDQTEKCNE